MNLNHSRPRVVVTGLGAITPLGLTVRELWQGLLAGRSGIGRITQFDASHLPCQIAGEIKGFDPTDYMDSREARRIARSAQVALVAAMEAVRDAGYEMPWPNAERVGIVLGTAIGGLDRADDGIQILRTKGLSKISPFLVPAALPNMPTFCISAHFRLLGPTSTIATACATGSQAVGEATELIRARRADIVICGGTEAVIRDFAIAGFSAMRGLATSFNDRPEKASRPFDRRREGFIFSEGAGVLVLENYQHARARGARMYAEVLGHATSSDSYHMAAPDPTAEGAIRAMRWALEDAGLQPHDVNYINAHGTSTLINDATETLAIKKLFGEHAYGVPISSTKSMIGHSLGAAGALEAIACALSIREGCVHPTINYETPDPDCDLDYVPNESRSHVVTVALSNSFGLGGQNACLVLGKVS